MANCWLRLVACAVVGVVAAAVVGHSWPLVWFAGMAAALLVDRAVFRKLHSECTAEGAPRLRGIIWWTAAQSAYGGVLGAMLWMSQSVPSDTLAAFYFCGALANAAATLRVSPSLALAGVGPTLAFMFALPLADYALNGRNPLDLMPLVGALLLLGFGINLWRSLIASDEAHAQAEAAVMRERQAAAAAAAAKTDTIQRMNDELRTPMAALIGAAEHLRRAAATPQARAQIAMLAEAGEVLKLVLDDLSDLDRLENGRLRILAAPADPRELLRGVVAAFRSAAQDKRLELFLDVAPDIPALLVIDAARVRQALFNLLANAVRYTAHGGVRVSLSVQPGDHSGSVRLAFVIADTGAGMSRAQLALAFADGRSASPKGGLGLAISLRLAKLMGGQLMAKSEPGEGSVFSLILPASLAEGAARTSAA